LVSLVLRLLLVVTFFSGCQIGHVIYVSYSHLSMLNSARPIEEVLKEGKLTDEKKRKVLLTQEVKAFAYEKLGIKKSKNYSEYVDLGRQFVVYNVNASEKWKFEPYLWNFPVIGKAPYIGFFSEEKALEEARSMQKKNYDTSVGGVSAYSTLGNLTDPLLSSMLNYSDYQLSNTIIHELVHTHLFIKDNINFNERLAVFVANKGTEMFYLQKEGAESATLKKVRDENSDDELFSKFISEEIAALKRWYADFDHSRNLPAEDKEKLREERLHQIAVNFEANLKPKLKTRSYKGFFSKKFNNADLITFNTYMKNLDDFEKVYQQVGANIPAFLKKCEQLTKVDDAEAELHKWATASATDQP